MAVLGLLNHFPDIWPFSFVKIDDLKTSENIVKKLALPDHTKHFVFAIQDPQTRALVYILSAQNFSERSAKDAEYLIKEVCPDAVFVQTGATPILAHSQEFEFMYEGDRNDNPVPTSAFGVVKRCFVDTINKDEFDYIAGNLVLREIFGVGSFEHLLTAKRTSKEVGSSFFILESARVSPGSSAVDHSSETQTLGFQPGGLALHSSESFRSKWYLYFTTNTIHDELLKPLLLQVNLSMASPGSPGSSSDTIEPKSDYKPPPFAQPVYPLLLDLHNIFTDIPSIGRALGSAQKMLHDVGQGESIDAQTLSEVYTFQVALEGLRVAMNNAGRLSMNKMRNSASDDTRFSDLSSEEKSQCLLAQALRSQSKNFKTMVAIVDASELAGIRKFWSTLVPPEVEDTLEDLVLSNETNVEISKGGERKRHLRDKPVVTLGAGATAVMGVSSLSKLLPTSTAVKIISIKVPGSLKLFLAQTHKAFGIAASNILGPSKVVAHGLASSGAKASTGWKASASTGKLSAVTRNVIASAESTSFSAMRTAFYEIMRKREVQRVGFLPWATLGCSVATCAGLIVYGDGIECAIESLTSAPAIASLGRGIYNLQETSQAVGHSGRPQIQKAIESLIYRFRKSR